MSAASSGRPTAYRDSRNSSTSCSRCRGGHQRADRRPDRAFRHLGQPVHQQAGEELEVLADRRIVVVVGLPQRLQDDAGRDRRAHGPDGHPAAALVRLQDAVDRRADEHVLDDRAEVVVDEHHHGVRVLLVVVVEYDAQPVAGDVLGHDRAGQPEAGDPGHPFRYFVLRPQPGHMRPLQRQPPGRADRPGQTRQQDEGLEVTTLTEHPRRVGPEEPLDLADLVREPGRPQLVGEHRRRARHRRLGDHRMQRGRHRGHVEGKRFQQGLQHGDARRGVDVHSRHRRGRLARCRSRRAADGCAVRPVHSETWSPP